MTTYHEVHRRSLADRDAFWREQAALIEWHTPFKTVLDYSKPPFAKWFVGGRTNICHNAVDRHLAARRDQQALIYISTETGHERSYTFGELHAEVNASPRRCKAQGVGKATGC
jgi:propionyl-CoA synthetase